MLHFLRKKHVLSLPRHAAIPVVTGGGTGHVIYAYGVKVGIDAARPGRWWRDRARLLAESLAAAAGGVAFDERGQVGVIVHPLLAPAAHDILLAGAHLNGAPHPGIPMTPQYEDVLHTLGCLHPTSWGELVAKVVRVRLLLDGAWAIDANGTAKAAWVATEPMLSMEGPRRWTVVVGMAWEDPKKGLQYEEALVRGPWILEAKSGGLPSVSSPTEIWSALRGIRPDKSEEEEVEA